MAEEKTLKTKFILKWKHGISDEKVDMTNDPTLIAQRYINLYKCFQHMKPEEQAAYIEDLKKAPDGIRRLFLRATGGREVEAFYRYVKTGDISPLAIEEHEKEEAQQAAGKNKEDEESPSKNMPTPPPPPPTF